MKMFVNSNKKMMESPHSFYSHKVSSRPTPPHERKALMNIVFDEEDWKLLKEIFGDEDTAFAASEVIKEAPPEIQILVIQLMNIIEEVA